MQIGLDRGRDDAAADDRIQSRRRTESHERRQRPDAGTYTLSPTTPEPNDLAVNQYTSIPHAGGTNNTFDTNGNLTAKGADAYEYDYRNQLIDGNAQIREDVEFVKHHLQNRGHP